MMTDSVLPSLDVARLVRRQLHVLLALDCSGSMRGSKIASLNYAVRAALPELRGVAAANPEVDVRVRALRFATTVDWHIESPTPIDALDWPDLAADGETNMGEALTTLAGVLTADALRGRQLLPVIVLVSDGCPSDDIEAGLAAVMSSYYGSRALRVAISIGSDADEDILERFIGRPPMRPLQANNAQDLVQHIKWATTTPVKSVSAPTNAPDPIAALARDAAHYQPEQSDLIW
jgi:uncharacterized protein YegL